MNGRRDAMRAYFGPATGDRALIAGDAPARQPGAAVNTTTPENARKNAPKTSTSDVIFAPSTRRDDADIEDEGAY